MPNSEFDDDVNKHVYGAPNPDAKKDENKGPSDWAMVAMFAMVCFSSCFIFYTIFNR